MTQTSSTTRKLPPPKNSVGQNTRGIFRALETSLTRALNSVGVRYSHFQVLHVLWHGDGLSQGEIAESTFITDSSFAQVIADMLEEGLVSRRRDEKDGRRRLIYLTEKGKAVEPLVTTPVLSVMDVALDGVTDEERTQYLKVCRKIYGNLRGNFDLRTSNGPGRDAP